MLNAPHRQSVSRNRDNVAIDFIVPLTYVPVDSAGINYANIQSTISVTCVYILVKRISLVSYEYMM